MTAAGPDSGSGRIGGHTAEPAALEGEIRVCALYKFVTLDDFETLRQPFQEKCDSLALKGTVLLANEGINGTIAGAVDAVNAFIEFLEADQRLRDIDYKFALAAEMPFYRMKIKLKKEIVTLGVAGIDPNRKVGAYVEPQDWNELISDPNVLLIDTRNDYEVEVGSFAGAVDPDMASFRDFPSFVTENCDPEKHKKIAMFCTGGIRCEKASAYMLEKGFEEVYHLKGGILNYFEQVDEKDSRWKGDCFVFDNRVTVDHALSEGNYDQCHACRRPINAADKRSDEYEEGISCPRCFNDLSDERKQRFAERQKQIALAKARNEAHIGAKPPSRQTKKPVK